MALSNESEISQIMMPMKMNGGIEKEKDMGRESDDENRFKTICKTGE